MRALKGHTTVDECAEIPQALDDARQLCNEAGVALVWVKPLPKARVSGAAWWLSPRKPVIALSARHKSDDHLWFSLFHEAAHILFHSKKRVFVDGDKDGENEDEAEANDWAARTSWYPSLLGSVSLPPARIGSARKASSCFADEQGIAPGIVVGRLQHEGRSKRGGVV